MAVLLGYAIAPVAYLFDHMFAQSSVWFLQASILVLVLLWHKSLWNNLTSRHISLNAAQHRVYWPRLAALNNNDQFWTALQRYHGNHPHDDFTPAINALGLDRIATFFESALYKEYDEISIAMKQHINNFDHRAQCLWALYDHDQEAFKALQSLRQEVLAPALSLPVMN